MSDISHIFWRSSICNTSIIRLFLRFNIGMSPYRNISININIYLSSIRWFWNIIYRRNCWTTGNRGFKFWLFRNRYISIFIFICIIYFNICFSRYILCIIWNYIFKLWFFSFIFFIAFLYWLNFGSFRFYFWFFFWWNHFVINCWIISLIISSNYRPCWSSCYFTYIWILIFIWISISTIIICCCCWFIYINISYDFFIWFIHTSSISLRFYINRLINMNFNFFIIWMLFFFIIFNINSFISFWCYCIINLLIFLIIFVDIVWYRRIIYILRLWSLHTSFIIF